MRISIPMFLFLSNRSFCFYSAIVTLPWHDDLVTHRIYSVGTRFVGKPELDNETGYAVLVLTDADTTKISWIPYTHALRGYAQTQDERIQRFVQVLKQWAQIDSIAYIWGGCSFTKAYTAQEFYPIVLQQGIDQTTCWIRPDKTRPYSGFDCSGLVLRAAQIAGLPYFFKNTMVLSTHLQELKEDETLEEGDLIYCPRHVIIVSDLQNNQIIESVGYSSGYGRVHSLPLDQVFENIHTFNDLLAAYRAHMPLKRLKLGINQTNEIKEYKLLKLRSVFSPKTEQSSALGQQVVQLAGSALEWVRSAEFLKSLKYLRYSNTAKDDKS